MTDEAELREAARSLYATPLPEFITVRKRLAQELRTAGDAESARRLATFKKPSVAADFVNRLVRDGRELADEITELGVELRAAQADADAATLRGLDQQRRELLSRVVAWVRAEADKNGGTATEAVLRDVEQTIWAAVVDAHAAATVQAGMLLKPLSPGGFGEVDVSGASAIEIEAPVETSRPTRRRSPKRPDARPATEPAEPAGPSAAEIRARREATEALEAAQTSAQAAQRDLEEAARLSEDAEARRAELEEQRRRISAELADVDRRLRDVRQELIDGRAALKLAEKQRRTAAAEVDRALRAADRA